MNRVVSIRDEDYQLLANLSKIEERDMTQVLHRALALYSESQKDAKVPKAILARANR